MKRSKFTDSKIMEALKRVDAGLAVPDICRELAISTATFYKWHSKYGIGRYHPETATSHGCLTYSTSEGG